MADKLTKLLARLPPKERDRVLLALERLRQGDTQGMNIRALVGYKHMYRARVGRLRIIYRQESGIFTLRSVSERDEDTYKNL